MTPEKHLYAVLARNEGRGIIIDAESYEDIYKPAGWVQIGTIYLTDEDRAAGEVIFVIEPKTLQP
jgi:hypothetical protein